jgi:hypothetical protein
MHEKLNELVGASGVTTDELFDEITAILEKEGTMVEDKEIAPSNRQNNNSELVITQYNVNGYVYELWYQVRTPFSDKDMTCSYGFEGAAPTVHNK